MPSIKFKCACGRTRYISTTARRVPPCSTCASQIRSQVNSEARRIERELRRKFRI